MKHGHLMVSVLFGAATRESRKESDDNWWALPGGSVVNGVPRMNLFFKASVPEAQLGKTAHISEWKWFAKDEFMGSELHGSYHKAAIAGVIFR